MWFGAFPGAFGLGSRDLAISLPLLGPSPLTGPSNAEHPQPKPAPGPNGLARAALKPNPSPPHGSQPVGGPGVQGWPPSGGLLSMDSWPSEDPWPMLAAAVEDPVGEVLPGELSYLSRVAALHMGSRPWPAGPSAHPGDPSHPCAVPTDGVLPRRCICVTWPL